MSENLTLADGRLDRSSLDSRIRIARAALARCELCEHRCGANRLVGDSSPCRLGGETYCVKRDVSYVDESGLVPTLRVYWSGCNFRCEFCDALYGNFGNVSSVRTWPGERVEAGKFASELHEAAETGIKAAHFLGGEASLHVHTILEIVAATAKRWPLILTTNAYMTTELLELLKGVIDVYRVHFKFGNDRCASRIARVPGYMRAVTRNLAIMSEYATLRVRHLLLPGHLDCCFRPVVDWLSAWMPASRFHLLTRRVPAGRAAAASHPGMDRLNNNEEILAAVDYLESRQLDWCVDVRGDSRVDSG